MLLLHLPKNRSQMQNEQQYERERKDNVELEKQEKGSIRGHCSSKRVVRLRSRIVGYETVCDIHLAPVLLLFVFDIFKLSAEASWMAYITQSINSERRSAG